MLRSMGEPSRSPGDQRPLHGQEIAGSASTGLQQVSADRLQIAEMRIGVGVGRARQR
jgi:hypothetical protein